MLNKKKTPSTVILILGFMMFSFSQEVEDTISGSNNVSTSFYFRKVHRDTIYKIKKLLYISKDTCPEEHRSNINNMLLKCPSSEKIEVMYVRNKRMWKSINSGKIIEKGKFKSTKGYIKDIILPPYKRFPDIVKRHGKWEYYNKLKNETIIKEYKKGVEIER